MIRSMTGFGQASGSAGGFAVSIDVRSVNHRYQEVTIRMPREWIVCEDALKKQIQKRLSRGRVDVFITMEREKMNESAVQINWPLLDGYIKAAQAIHDRYNLTDPITVKDLLALPDSIGFQSEVAEDKDEVINELHNCLSSALDQLLVMRETEGRHLDADLRSRLSNLQSSRTRMITLAPQAVQEYASKLRERVNELLNGIDLDETRLATEVVLFADRVNIEEELTRLDSHFKQFGQLIGTDEPVGRKLDFLIQEMNREVNTIGSKANQGELVSLVVDMKAELEKMREQVQNIE